MFVRISSTSRMVSSKSVYTFFLTSKSVKTSEVLGNSTQRQYTTLRHSPTCLKAGKWTCMPSKQASVSPSFILRSSFNSFGFFFHSAVSHSWSHQSTALLKKAFQGKTGLLSDGRLHLHCVLHWCDEWKENIIYSNRSLARLHIHAHHLPSSDRPLIFLSTFYCTAKIALDINKVAWIHTLIYNSSSSEHPRQINTTSKKMDQEKRTSARTAVNVCAKAFHMSTVNH